MAQQIGHPIVAGIRWSARIVGFVAAGLCVLYLVQPDGVIPQALAGNGLAGTPLFLVLAVAVAGGAVAWWQEAAGGLMGFGGGVLILAMACSQSGTGIPLAAFVLTLPLLVSGFVHVLGTVVPRVLGEEGTTPAQVAEGNKWAAAGRV